MKRVLLSMAILMSMSAGAQMNESFSDGNYTLGTAWSGTTNWQVFTHSDVAAGATGSNTLRLVESGAGGNYLSTQVGGSWGLSQSWGFWMGRRNQAAADDNQMFVWLYANDADITSPFVDGYRIRFGDNGGGDEIYLESIIDGEATTIITSAGSVTNAITDFGFLVRVTRNAAGEWTLYTSTLPTASGTGAVATMPPTSDNTNVLQGSVTNTAITSFVDGYVAIETTNTSGAGARSGAEFDQFRMVFSENATLPVNITNLKATQAGAGVNVQWNNLTESDVNAYELERSSNGRSFYHVGQVAAMKNDGGKASYQLNDASPLKGNSYYRIRVTEKTGKTFYSDIVKMTIGGASAGMVIYPNPVRGNNVALQLSNLQPGKYVIRMYNNAAQLMSTETVNHAGGSYSQTISIDKMKAGVYTVEFSGNVKLQQQLIIQ